MLCIYTVIVNNTSFFLHYLCNMNSELKKYVEAEILPRYNAFDKAHSIEHVTTVIEQSLALATHYNVDVNMVYAIAAYHDLGIVNGREHHHTDSGKILLADAKMRDFFSEEQLLTMRDAIEDHRASSDHEPRTIYGKIVAEADRDIDPQRVILRVIQFGLQYYPEKSKEEHFERLVAHLKEKYAEGGYLKLWIPYSDNARKIRELRAIMENRQQLRELFESLWQQEKKL